MLFQQIIKNNICYYETSYYEFFKNMILLSAMPTILLLTIFLDVDELLDAVYLIKKKTSFKINYLTQSLIVKQDISHVLYIVLSKYVTI